MPSKEEMSKAYIVSVENKVIEMETQIETLKKNNSQTLMVGYNRRFSPHAVAIKDSLEINNEPINNLNHILYYQNNSIKIVF